MRVAARHRGQHAVGRRHAVTAGFDRQLDDIFRIKVQRVGGKGGARRVLHALVNRQNGKVAGSPVRPVLYRVCILRSTAGGRLLSTITRST